MTAIQEGVRDARDRPVTRGPLRPRPWLIAVPAIAYFFVASALMLQERQPFVNWYYISAWYPTILVLDALQARLTGRYYLITRPGFALSLLGWSAVLWFFFEVVNIRVANWYYVFLPPERAARWLGTTISFATVFPAIFLAERVLASRNAFDRIRAPTFAVGPRMLIGVFGTGIAFAVLSLVWPRAFFPMIWGALTLLIEPLNYRLDRSRSLLADLSNGRPGRLLRFLAGGVAVGFLWEMYNIESRSKWIYTVPGFENFKLFEMPLLGFLGFPVFALDCFVVYQALVLLRVAIPDELGPAAGKLWVRPGRTIAAAVAAIVFSLAALVGMDRWNTDSLRPRLAELWVLDDEQRAGLAENGLGDVFVLAREQPADVAERTGSSVAAAEEWVSIARVATLRGIGMANAQLLWQAGVSSVTDLAATDAGELRDRLRGLAERPRAATPPKVRVWVQAARQMVDAAGTTAAGVE